jgi:hypothetical protein
MKLVEKLMQGGQEYNITGNGGVHYNGVRITEVYDDFIAVEPGNTAVRNQGQFRGEKVYVNISSITRLEDVELGQTPYGTVKGDLLGRRRL